MKYNIVRILAGLTFLIFFCPFFQMCSDDSILQKVETTEEVTSDSVNAEQVSTKSIINKIPEEKYKLEENRKNHALNGYELAYINFKEINKLTFDDIIDSGFVFFSFYTLIVFSSSILLINTIRKRMKIVFYLSVANLLLGISSLILFVTDLLFEEISQIKFGYYLFIINTLALIIFSRKIKTPSAA